VVWQRPGTSGRLYAAVAPAGRPAGHVWAERAAGDPWAETDRAAFVLAARLIERCPAVAAVAGAVPDPDRLNRRLADAAVVCGRMAHDFDNVLTGIIGFTELTQPLVAPGTQPAKYLAEIAKVGQRGVTFTQQLHQLSRSGQARPQPGSVSTAVAKEDARIRANGANGVTVGADVPANLALVAMDPAPLGLVLGHLLDNAVQASPPGGRVVVTARGCDLTAADARGYLGACQPGPHVEVTVQDAGPGVKPDVRAKLFHEPFTTTKAGRRGLGLAIAYRTLAAHRGGVRLDTGPTGTAARFVIPVAAARPAVLATHYTPTAIGADRP
jgi:signal transduction histidine kinase